MGHWFKSTILHKNLGWVLFMAGVWPVKKNKHASPTVFGYLLSEIFTVL